ncbi:hypothetical protein [uncultured Lamprocystis sp.]|jgi:hypothetical protein|nr:hypothetical protein [uncultured Lamprocystis sp.]
MAKVELVINDISDPMINPNLGAGDFRAKSLMVQATSEQRVSKVPCTMAVEPSKLVPPTSENDSGLR